jgi:hypothetical protein
MEAAIVAVIAVAWNIVSVVYMARMWQRRHDLMVSKLYR